MLRGSAAPAPADIIMSSIHLCFACPPPSKEGTRQGVSHAAKALTFLPVPQWLKILGERLQFPMAGRLGGGGFIIPSIHVSFVCRPAICFLWVRFLTGRCFKNKSRTSLHKHIQDVALHTVLAAAERLVTQIASKVQILDLAEQFRGKSHLCCSLFARRWPAISSVRMHIFMKYIYMYIYVYIHVYVCICI